MYRELVNHRELIFTLVKRDLKIRYKASALGFLWSFGRPLFLMLVMWAVFSQIVKIETEIPYPLHLLTGLLPWMFFTGALIEAQGSILYNSNVVKKIKLPTAAFPAAAVLSNLVHLLLAMLILFVFILGYTFFADPALFPGWEIVFLPFIIILQFAILMGLALILAALNVFYRDVTSISEILITAWFYLTPIIYPVQMARDKLKGMLAPAEADPALTYSFSENLLYYLYLCNPMTPVITAYRRVLYGRHLRVAPEISDATLMIGLGISAVFAILLLWVGSRLFDRLSKRFADEL